MEICGADNCWRAIPERKNLLDDCLQSCLILSECIQRAIFDIIGSGNTAPISSRGAHRVAEVHRDFGVRIAAIASDACLLFIFSFFV